MKGSWFPGLLLGALVGATIASAVLSARREVGKDPAAEVERRKGEEERRRLALRVLELENQLAARPVELESRRAATKEPPPAAAVEPAVPVAKPDLAAGFAALVEKGLAAYGGAEFQALAKRVRESGKEAIDLLAQSLLKGASSGERFMAAALLEAAGDPAAIPALAESLKNEADLLVRRMASHAIALIGTGAAGDPLRAAMTGDKDWGVRVNAAYGVAKLGGEDGLTMLREAYASPDTPAMYRGAILGGLADVAAPSMAPFFRRLLSDTRDETFLFLAIGALSKMKDAAARPDLERLASSDLPETLREAARKALENLDR